MQTPHFYAVIIGSEILNGRRIDKHFNFVRDTLLSRGHFLYTSLTIKDDPLLIRNTFEFVKNDSDSVMFSFGGIGSTPDDLTRQIAADVFGDGILYPHEKFRSDIIERFHEEAYPYRIHMADLPANAGLLHNIINNMSGFYLEDRYFFMPGFPEMSHPMVEEALTRFFPLATTVHRKTLIAQTSENTLIDVMNSLPEEIDFSSLPMLRDGRPSVEISIASHDESESIACLQLFITALEAKKIDYVLI
ncbi:MAG: molybdopterin-binding protein [Sulfuricurvum sp. MLSB]|uniref:competence/damage-inducible protein A n=1 Tax=unclassified Sulfuricurvum TaxID=2632390 RepID=UPI0005038854|nr:MULTISPECIES: molybdopterin-binding protein [unclassified Sulfuricurvum]KFN40736.1 MAG: molybdopterin-binding protein [Sulfuricurvum sp. MLSB]